LRERPSVVDERPYNAHLEQASQELDHPFGPGNGLGYMSVKVRMSAQVARQELELQIREPQADAFRRLLGVAVRLRHGGEETFTAR
jgi:hypothetical protein